MKLPTCFVICSLLLIKIRVLDNGLARIPPMGWISTLRFGCVTDCNLYPDDCISDKLIRQMADLMCSEGYLEAGYEYVIIEDCWEARTRNKQGRLRPDPKRFPYGMKNLSGYVHNKGLKFGLYQNLGTLTCGGYLSIKGHLEVDTKTFAEWEIDYIKISACNARIEKLETGFVEFGKFLNQTGRPIVYSCTFPVHFEHRKMKVNYGVAAKTCNLWRNWIGIVDSYNSLTGIMDWFGKNQNKFASYAGPGHWNDPDMLLIGNFHLSYEQSKTQMAIWSIVASPLLISADLRTMRNAEKKILLHKEAIAINQDSLGIQGKKIASILGIDVWMRPISPIVGGLRSYAIAFQSRRVEGYPFAFQVKLADLGLDNVKGYAVTNVFESGNREEGYQINDQFIIRVRPSGVVFLKVISICA